MLDTIPATSLFFRPRYARGMTPRMRAVLAGLVALADDPSARALSIALAEELDQLSPRDRAQQMLRTRGWPRYTRSREDLGGGRVQVIRPVGGARRLGGDCDDSTHYVLSILRHLTSLRPRGAVPVRVSFLGPNRRNPRHVRAVVDGLPVDPTPGAGRWTTPSGPA